MNTRTRKSAILAAAAISMVALSASPAAASCAPPPEKRQHLAEAEIVFVGTVEALENENYWATVRVEEVWKGPDQPQTVTVHGSSASGPEQARTSVDRNFEPGVRYLFAPRGDGAPYSDNACSATEKWHEGLAQYRPADWRKPVPASSGGAGAAGSADGTVTTTGGEAGDSTPPPDTPDSDTGDGETGDGDTGGGEIINPGEGSGQSDEELADDSKILDGDAASSSGGGLDRGLLLSGVGILLGLIGLGWWLRKDA